MLMVGKDIPVLHTLALAVLHAEQAVVTCLTLRGVAVDDIAVDVMNRKCVRGVMLSI